MDVTDITRFGGYSAQSMREAEELPTGDRAAAEEEAFPQLFAQFAKPIIAFIYDMVGERGLAEELAQPTSPAPAPANVSGRDGRDGSVAFVQDKARRRVGTPAAASGRRGGAGGESGGATYEAKALTPTSPAPPAGVAAFTPVAEAMLFAGTQPGAPWAEPRRHFERSQLLLRSFRNSEFAPGAGLADFAYEKRQSRQLLSRNVVLRRATAARGDLLEEALLGDLEAILRDIAELPARPLRGRLSSIKQQIERSEIVADLQIYAAQTSTSATGY